MVVVVVVCVAYVCILLSLCVRVPVCLSVCLCVCVLLHITQRTYIHIHITTYYFGVNPNKCNYVLQQKPRDTSPRTNSKQPLRPRPTTVIPPLDSVFFLVVL